MPERPQLQTENQAEVAEQWHLIGFLLDFLQDLVRTQVEEGHPMQWVYEERPVDPLGLRRWQRLVLEERPDYLGHVHRDRGLSLKLNRTEVSWDPRKDLKADKADLGLRAALGWDRHLRIEKRDLEGLVLGEG